MWNKLNNLACSSFKSRLVSSIRTYSISGIPFHSTLIKFLEWDTFFFTEKKIVPAGGVAQSVERMICEANINSKSGSRRFDSRHRLNKIPAPYLIILYVVQCVVYYLLHLHVWSSACMMGSCLKYILTWDFFFSKTKTEIACLLNKQAIQNCALGRSGVESLCWLVFKSTDKLMLTNSKQICKH